MPTKVIKDDLQNEGTIRTMVKKENRQMFKSKEDTSARKHYFRNIFILILLLGLLLRIVTALSFENMLWPDEIYQTLEQAHRIVFGVGIIPWEFRDGTRSFIFPGLLAIFLFPFRYFIISSSFCYTAFIKIILCVFSTSLIIFSYLYARQLGLKYAGILAAIFTSFWYELIYFSPKAFSEVFASYLILPGLFFVEILLKNRNIKNAVIGGILLGLGVSFRIHYIIIWIISFLFITFCDFKARNYYPTFCYLIASSVVILLSGILDWVVWGSFFHSYIENVYINIIKGRGTRWGIMPFGWYLDILRNNMGWLLILSVIVSVLAFHRSKLLSLSLLSIFFLHSLIPHKEYRFIFIVISFLSITSAVGIDILVCKISLKYLRNLIISLIVISFLYTSFRLAPKYTIEKMGYFRNNSLGRQSAWTAFQDNFLVYRFLSSLPDLWGLQDNISYWYFSAGYYYLHKDIPIYTIDRLTQEEIFNNKFANYIITREVIARDDLELIKTLNGIYVYRKNFLKKREIDAKYNTNR